jgi:hypothetical protein
MDQAAGRGGPIGDQLESNHVGRTRAQHLGGMLAANVLSRAEGLLIEAHRRSRSDTFMAMWESPNVSAIGSIRLKGAALDRLRRHDGSCAKAGFLHSPDLRGIGL